MTTTERAQAEQALSKTISRMTGCQVQAELTTNYATGSYDVIATWRPEDDDQVMSQLTTNGFTIENHDPHMPDLGCGDGGRAGALLKIA